MKITETYVRKLIREALAQLTETEAAIKIDEDKVYEFASYYFDMVLDSPTTSNSRETTRDFLSRNLGGEDASKKANLLVIGNMRDAIEKVLGGVSIESAAEECVDNAFDYLASKGKIDSDNPNVNVAKRILITHTEEILKRLSNLPVEKIAVDVPASAPASPAVAAGGSTKKAGIPYSKNVEEIQKLIGGYAGGITPDGKWGGKTQEAFKAFLEKIKPALQGATTPDILRSWKDYGPKITSVNDRDIAPRYTPDVAGILRFVKDVSPARNIKLATAVPAGEKNRAAGRAAADRVLASVGVESLTSAVNTPGVGTPVKVSR
jgi:hypothetical protein